MILMWSIEGNKFWRSVLLSDIVCFLLFSFCTWTKCKLWDQCCSSRTYFNECVFCACALFGANKLTNGLNVVIRSSHLYHSRNNPRRNRWESFTISVELNCESNWAANRTKCIILTITLEEKDDTHLRLVSNWTANWTELNWTELKCVSKWTANRTGLRTESHISPNRISYLYRTESHIFKRTELRTEVNFEPKLIFAWLRRRDIPTHSSELSISILNYYLYYEVIGCEYVALFFLMSPWSKGNSSGAQSSINSSKVYTVSGSVSVMSHYYGVLSYSR